MSERLRPRDLAFLEPRRRPRHATTPPWRSSTPATRSDRSLRLRPARGADPRPDLVRAALPPARPGRCRGGSPTRSGSTTSTSTSATTYAAPRCPARATPSSCASWSRGSSRVRSTGAGRCGRSTSSRGWPTAGSRCSTRPTRRSSTASRPSTSARCCSTRTPGAKILGGDEWRAAPAPLARRAAGRRAPRQPSPSRDTALDTVRQARSGRRCAAPRTGSPRARARSSPG